MAKKCVLCEMKINEEHGKMKGTILRVCNEEKRRSYIPVCSECQKNKDWIHKAKIKGV